MPRPTPDSIRLPNASSVPRFLLWGVSKALRLLEIGMASGGQGWEMWAGTSASVAPPTCLSAFGIDMWGLF